MILFGIFLILGLVFAFAHGVYLHRFGNYLKEHHPSKWKEIVPKSFLQISQANLESRNYFTEMGFVFSSEHLKDQRVKFFKSRIRLLFLLAVISWLSMLVSFLLI